jgi:hypothetical protein
MAQLLRKPDALDGVAGMTAYIHELTIIVPEAHIDAGNALALVLGENPADDQTFGPARWQDADGNRYSACNTVAKPIFVYAAATPLVAPEFAPDADLALASQGQAIVTIYDPENPVTASPDRILAILDMTPQAAFAAAGVTLIDEDDGA